MELVLSLDLLRQPIRHVRLNAATPEKSPTTGKRWLVLGGTFGHTTLTQSEFRLQVKGGAYFFNTQTVAAAKASTVYPIFHAGTDELYNTGAGIWLLDEYLELAGAGGAGWYIDLTILEF